MPTNRKAIGRVAKAMGILSEVTKSFDSKVGIATPSGKHSDPKIAQDLKCLTERLIDCNIFNPQNQHTYNSFHHLKKNLIRTLEEENLKSWMVERFSMLLQPYLSAHNVSNISNDSQLY